ncbi:MAG: hypothetical protein H6837_17875 [Planctomycetes bacterium]|nr:hypothetical protein [Planctomycetota bacterium]
MHPTRVLRAAILAFAAVQGVGPAHAQTASNPTLQLPPQPTALLHLEGPAVWRAVHARDPLGRWFRSPQLAAAWAGVVRDAQPWLAERRTELAAKRPRTAELLGNLLQSIPGFDGSVTLALDIDAPFREIDAAFRANRPQWDSMCLWIRIDPGRANPKPWLDAAGEWFAELCPDRPRTLRIGGTDVTVARIGKDGPELAHDARLAAHRPNTKYTVLLKSMPNGG